MKENVYVPKIVEQEVKPNSESKEKKRSKSPMISIAVPLRKKRRNEKKKKLCRSKLQHEWDVEILFTSASVETTIFRRTRNMVKYITKIL